MGEEKCPWAVLTSFCIPCCRVEGKGSAVITDVIYSSKKIDEEQQSSPGTKEEYEAVKVNRVE